MQSKTRYSTYMIVFEKSKQRYQNYQNLNRRLKGTIRKFSAIDTINEYARWKIFALANNYCTEGYIANEVEKFGPGKLGCNLSHLLLYKKLNDEHGVNGSEWYLVLEDDVGIHPATYQELDQFINTLLDDIETKSADTQYVQLCIYDKFLARQSAAPRVFGSTHAKVRQYGTCAYLINLNAIRYLHRFRPWDMNIDFLFNTLHGTFNSLATLNHYFYSQGTESRTDHREHKHYGSLIWD